MREPASQAKQTKAQQQKADEARREAEKKMAQEERARTLETVKENKRLVHEEEYARNRDLDKKWHAKKEEAKKAEAAKKAEKANEKAAVEEIVKKKKEDEMVAGEARKTEAEAEKQEGAKGCV